MRAPNAVQGNDNPENLIPVVVFPNMGLGCGYGPTTRGIGPEGGLPPGYHRTNNVTVLDGSRFAPSFAPPYRLDTYSSVQQFPPSFLHPWRDGSGFPIALMGLGSAAWLFANNAIASETDATTATYGNACLHDDGSGVELFYAGTFTASTGAAAKLNRRTAAGTWSEDADVNAKFIVPVAGALWRTTSDYEVSVCPAGSEPFTIANWGSSIRVGTNTAKIVNGAGLGALVIWFKEDGIYIYDESDSRFVNRYEVSLSQDNFPFAKPDGEGGLLTATASGELVQISAFGQIDTVRLLDGKSPGRDTPSGPIVDAVIDGADIWFLMEPAYRMAQPSGLKVLKTTDNFSTFTDGTTNALDGSRATGLDISSLDTLANGDAILIGFDDQFLAVRAVMGAAVNGNAGTLAGAVSSGAGTWVGVTIDDGTNLFAHGGAIAIKLDISADISGWVKATYGGFSKFWMRLTASAALDATVLLAEVFISQRRAAPAFTGDISVDNAAVWEASGMLTKVLRGRKSNGQLIVDDIYTLYAVGTPPQTQFRTPGSNKIATCGLPTLNSPQGSLIVAARDEFNQLPLPVTKDSLRTPYAFMPGSILFAYSPPPIIYPQPVDLGPELYTVRFIEVIGQGLTEESHGFRVAFRWDETNAWWSSKLHSSNSMSVEIEGANLGSRLHTAIQPEFSGTSPATPTGSYVIYWVKPAEEAIWRHRSPDRTAPEAG